MTSRDPTSPLLPYTTLFRSKGIHNSEGAELVAVCDIDKEVGDKAAAEHNVPVYYSIEELLNQKDVEIDVVSICTPSSLHPDRKSTRLNSSHVATSYAVFCLN